jgi:hypothetical protein
LVASWRRWERGPRPFVARFVSSRRAFRSRTVYWLSCRCRCAHGTSRLPRPALRSGRWPTRASCGRRSWLRCSCGGHRSRELRTCADPVERQGRSFGIGVGPREQRPRVSSCTAHLPCIDPSWLPAAGFRPRRATHQRRSMQQPPRPARGRGGQLGTRRPGRAPCVVCSAP